MVQTGESSRAVWPLQKASESSEYADHGRACCSRRHTSRPSNFDESVRAANRVLEVDPERLAALRVRAMANLIGRCNLEDVPRADTARLEGDGYPDDYADARAARRRSSATSVKLEEAERGARPSSSSSATGERRPEPPRTAPAWPPPLFAARTCSRTTEKAKPALRGLRAAQSGRRRSRSRTSSSFFDKIERARDRATEMLQGIARRVRTPRASSLKTRRYASRLRGERRLRSGAEKVLREAVDSFGSTAGLECRWATSTGNERSDRPTALEAIRQGDRAVGRRRATRSASRARTCSSTSERSSSRRGGRAHGLEQPDLRLSSCGDASLLLSRRSEDRPRRVRQGHQRLADQRRRPLHGGASPPATSATTTAPSLGAPRGGARQQRGNDTDAALELARILLLHGEYQGRGGLLDHARLRGPGGAIWQPERLPRRRPRHGRPGRARPGASDGARAHEASSASCRSRLPSRRHGGARRARAHRGGDLLRSARATSTSASDGERGPAAPAARPTRLSDDRPRARRRSRRSMRPSPSRPSSGRAVRAPGAWSLGRDGRRSTRRRQSPSRRRIELEPEEQPAPTGGSRPPWTRQAGRPGPGRSSSATEAYELEHAATATAAYTAAQLALATRRSRSGRRSKRLRRVVDAQAPGRDSAPETTWPGSCWRDQGEPSSTWHSRLARGGAGAVDHASPRGARHARLGAAPSRGENEELAVEVLEEAAVRPVPSPRRSAITWGSALREVGRRARARPRRCSRLRSTSGLVPRGRAGAPPSWPASTGALTPGAAIAVSRLPGAFLLGARLLAGARRLQLSRGTLRRTRGARRGLPRRRSGRIDDALIELQSALKIEPGDAEVN